MPLFTKKEEESEQFINELKTDEQNPKSQITNPEPLTPKPESPIPFKKPDQLSKGTFTISILSDNFEFARFTIKPEIFTEAIEMLKNLISTLEEPQLKINSNCDCIWCQQKIKEIKEYLKT